MSLGRNDECWCGSGAKYKKCHLDRDREKPVPLPAALNLLRGFFKSKQCLHPEASKSSCGKIINAHTVQRQGALAGIVDDTGHCLTFYPPSVTQFPEPQRRGWRDASTFSGFCDRHDSTTFAALETRPFTGDPEQCFLLAYRAECHELYQKQGSVRSHDPLRQIADRGMAPEDQAVVQAMQHAAGAAVAMGLADAEHHKRQMDTDLTGHIFSGYEALFIQFQGPISIVSSGAPTPNRALSGEEICDLADPDAVMPRLYVGVVPWTGGGAVVLVWRPGHSAVERFIGDLRSLRWDELPSVIVQFIFAYIENTYFSAQWWTSLSDAEKAHVRDLATMGDPYYTKWHYRPRLDVPWTVVRVSNTWARPG